jgi:hypothetical protein
MRAASILGLIVVLGCLGACTTSALSPSSSRPEGAETPPSFSQYSDVPIPPKAKMDVDHSLILGTGDGWLGRLVYSAGGNAGSVYDIYKSDMPTFGWQEIGSVRATTSIQTWQRGDRVATVQITDSTWGGADVILTVVPAARPNSGVAADPVPPVRTTRPTSPSSVR